MKLWRNRSESLVSIAFLSLDERIIIKYKETNIYSTKYDMLRAYGTAVWSSDYYESWFT